MRHELPPYPTNAIPQRPVDPVPVVAPDRVNVLRIIVRHSTASKVEQERLAALREQSRNIRFHKGY